MSTQLPQGPSGDSYKIYLCVHIIDDTDGLTVYNLPLPVTVMPNNEDIAASLLNSIDTNDASMPFLVDLNSGNLNLVSQNVIALTTSFNNIQTSPASASNATYLTQEFTQMASVRTYLVEKVTSLSVSDVSSIKVISSALASATQTTSQISKKSAVISHFVC